MNKHLLYCITLCTTLLTVSTPNAFARGNCAQNNLGNIVCAPPGGTILTNKDGMIVCGLGQCVVNKNGTILCSAQPGGTAFLNDAGVAVCTGICMSPSKNNCKGAR